MDSPLRGNDAGTLFVCRSLMAIVFNSRLLLVLFAAIASALSAGIFFAFSTFVMRALAQQPAAQGIAAMQAINITVITLVYSGFLWPGIGILGADHRCATALASAGYGLLASGEPTLSDRQHRRDNCRQCSAQRCPCGG